MEWWPRRENLRGMPLNVQDSEGTVYLVCLVYLVYLVGLVHRADHRNEQDKPKNPDEPDKRDKPYAALEAAFSNSS